MVLGRDITHMMAIFFCLFCPISLKTWVVSTALPPEREGAAETYGGSGGEEARGKYSYGLR